MGGNSPSTPQGLGGVFGANPGYQQPNQVAPIAQPQIQTPILPTPEQAAAATVARMQARTPMAAPVTAPVRGQNQQYGGFISRHSGDYQTGPLEMSQKKRIPTLPPRAAG